MLWEGRPLRDIREIDVRRLLESGLEEHLQLEYRSALYEDNDRGRREFLLDICMFANTKEVSSRFSIAAMYPAWGTIKQLG